MNKIKKSLIAVSLLAASFSVALADAGQHVSVVHGSILVLVYSLVGAAVLALGYRLFDKIISKVNLEDEVGRGNIAAAVLSAGVIVALAIVVAAAIAG